MGSSLPELLSILHSNRAQAHLLLENNRNALEDSQEAMRLNRANMKVRFSAFFPDVGSACWCKLKNISNKGFSTGLLSRSQGRLEIAGMEACSRDLQQRLDD